MHHKLPQIVDALVRMSCFDETIYTCDCGPLPADISSILVASWWSQGQIYRQQMMKIVVQLLRYCDTGKDIGIKCNHII